MVLENGNGERDKQPVVPPTDVFGARFNAVGHDQPVDHEYDTSKTGGQTPFQSEAWSRGTTDNTVIPANANVTVDGRPVLNGEKVVIQHADQVNIYNSNDGSPSEVQIVTNADRIRANMPQDIPVGPGTVGTGPYYGEAPYRGAPRFALNLDFGHGHGHGHGRYDGYDRHPQYGFGHGGFTPPFFPQHRGGQYGGDSDLSIGVGGIRIGNVNLGGRIHIPIGDNNNGGWNERPPSWEPSPSWGVTAQIGSGRGREHIPRHIPCNRNFNEERGSVARASYRADFDRTYNQRRDQMWNA